MKKLFFLIGSSGSGKTTATKAIEVMNLSDLQVCYSDSIKVPSMDEMVKQYGSQEEWQRQNTIWWVTKIKKEYLSKKDVLFDIQSRPPFIDEACIQNSISSYEVILFDCSDEERKRRLIIERKQPELANDQMMDWARYLRERCVGKNHTILDNTNLLPEQGLKRLLKIMGK
jgi:adenylate kinase family enzyme